MPGRRGVLFGKAFLRFAGRGTLTFRGKRNLILTSIFSLGTTRLPRPVVHASPGKSVPCLASPPLFWGPPGRGRRGQPPGGPPCSSRTQLAGPFEEHISAWTPFPPERSSQPLNRQARPKRLAELCAEPKRSLGRVFGDTARDSWRPFVSPCHQQQHNGL